MKRCLMLLLALLLSLPGTGVAEGEIWITRVKGYDFEEDFEMAVPEGAMADRIRALLSDTFPFPEAWDGDTHPNRCEHFNIRMDGKIYSLYYNTLDEQAWLAQGKERWGLSSDTGAMFEALYRQKPRNFQMIARHQALFSDYGWTLDYALGSMQINLPAALDITPLDNAALYFVYHDLFLRDEGYDITPHLGESVTVTIYRVHEGVNRIAWCPEDWELVQRDLGVTVYLRGIVLERQGTIIGAYLSAGRHDTTFALSLGGRTDRDILGEQTLTEYLVSRSAITEEEKRLAKMSPEEVLAYFGDAASAAQAALCFTREKRLKELSANMEDHALFAPVYLHTPMRGLTQVEKIEQLDHFYRVELENPTEDWGSNIYFPEMIWESPETGWKIINFYNSGL